MCKIVLNERLYWNKKGIIGTIEKSGNLKVEIDNQEIYLTPKNLVEFKKGVWRNSYKNDSIFVRIAT